MRTAKDLAIAYVAAVLFGFVGAHRFYLRNYGVAGAMLVSSLLGWYLSGIGWGLVILAAVVCWIIADLIRMPTLVRNANDRVIDA